MSTSPLLRALAAAAAAPAPISALWMLLTLTAIWMLLTLTAIGASADVVRGDDPGTALFAVAIVALVVHVVARALGHRPWPWSE